jgi:hypothetical protein
MPQGWSKDRVPDELRDYLETVFDAYENIWQDWPTEYRQIGDRGVAEGKIKLSTDPNWYGAEVGDYKASGPVVNIPANRLVGFEPDDKMNQPASKANVEKIVAGLKQGAKLPPLMVRQYKNGYQVLDGHHRFWAYKLLGVKSIPAQVVPEEDIEEITKQGVAEGKQPGQPVVDAILKVMPIAQEIWFHGSRATGKHRKNSDTDILVIVPDDLVGDQYLGVVRILQKLSLHFDNHDIQPARAGSNIHRVAQEEGQLLWSNQQHMSENFADGRNPQDKGDSKRHGINTKASVSSLRKTAKQGGRKGQLAHWLANMKAGRAKKKTNETVIGNLHFPQLTIAVDDHSIDRTRTRGIDPHTIDLSLKKLNAVADQLAQIEPNAQVWAYDAENNLGLGLRRISSTDMLFKLKTVVAARPFDGAIPIIELS